MMAGALPILQTAGAALGLIGSARQAFGKQPTVPTLSREEALASATQMLGPQWDRYVTEAQNKLAQNQIARGFFGQLPGAAQALTLQGNLGAERAAAIAQLAHQLMTGAQQLNLQQQQLNQAAMAGGISGLGQFAQIFGNMANQYPYFGIGWDRNSGVNTLPPKTYREPEVKGAW